MIHVCMCFADKKGTYSKFAGTTICSIFENTREKITVHLITDDSLTEENRERFEILADRYRQKIVFYNLSKIMPEKLKWAAEQIPKAKNNRMTLGDCYRIMAIDLFPEDIDRMIILDCDMTFNLDISELWQIDLKDYPIAAVPEFDSICRAANEKIMHANCIPVRKNLVDWQDYFNFATLVCNLKKLRGNSIFEKFVQVSKENPDFLLVAQDPFNCLFAKNYLKLPNRYNIFTRVLTRIGQSNLLESRIYHHAGNDYNFDTNNKIQQLFLTYFMKTPFCTQKIFSNFIKNYHDQQKNFSVTTRTILNSLSTKSRGFFFSQNNQPALMNIFSIKPEEKIILSNLEKSIDNLIIEMQSKNKIFFIVDNYELIKKVLTDRGFTENEDFFDATIFIRDKISNTFTGLDKTFVLNM